ncbi:MAG TPA: DUF6249 domain-containing protein [Parvularculaceae bacterium]|nr:DUF6249 domain-containing protein [Parvularculaceae bacterium]
MGVEIIVPIALFAAVALVFLAAYFFSYRKRRIVYDAIKVAIERTGQVDAALVEAIIRDKVGPYGDLRKGVILIAVALAFIVFGAVMNEEDTLRAMIGVASFPGLIGIAYVAFHFFAPREPIV